MTAPSPELIQSLKARYAEPHRAYHTWPHIEAMLRHFETHAALVNDRTAVLWATYWHDAIYDPKAKDNEAQSAALLSSQAGSMLDPATLDKACAFILATQTHEIPPGLSAAATLDGGALLDFDLSILAAPAPVFDRYEADVRTEYAFVEEPMFLAGRRMILERFLARDMLYFTPSLRALWEAPARDNLRRSIADLSDRLRRFTG